MPVHHRNHTPNIRVSIAARIGHANFCRGSLHDRENGEGAAPFPNQNQANDNKRANRINSEISKSVAFQAAPSGVRG